MINLIATGINLAMYTLIACLACLSLGALVGFIVAAMLSAARDTDIAYEDGEARE